MSLQFDTFDTLEDRRELVILFQKLGEKYPEVRAREIRAQWLESLIKSGTHSWQPEVNRDSCHPVGAYQLFIQIVGVLGVSIRDAAIALDKAVKEQ